jgi:hypothetical protein
MVQLRSLISSKPNASDKSTGEIPSRSILFAKKRIGIDLFLTACIKAIFTSMFE